MIVLSAPDVFLRTGIGLDASWQVALQMAARRGFQWGTQVVWPYGPLGYMDQPTYVYTRTWVTSVLALIAVHAVYCGALGAFLWRARIGPLGWLLAAATFLLPLDITLEYECVPGLVVLLYLGVETGRPWNGRLWVALAGILLALLAVVKGTGLLSAGALIVAFTVLSVGRRRPGLALTLIAAASAGFVALWLVAGQAPAGIPAYLRTSYELSSGYSAAMAYVMPAQGAPRRGEVVAAVLLVAASTFTAVVALTRRDIGLASIAWLSLPFLFVGFKEGFVRSDTVHHLRFYTEAILLQSPQLLLAIRRRGRLESAVSAIAVAVGAVMLVISARSVPVGEPPAWQVQTVGDRLSSYAEAAALLSDPGERRRQSSEAIAQMRATYQVPDAVVSRLREGSADVVPYDLEIAYAYGLNWTPRPVLQTYSAFTPELDRMDAAHFSGSSAPDRVLLQWSAIDGRYPLFEEPEATWVLLHRYRLEEVAGPYLVLVRDTNRASKPGTRLDEATAPLGTEIPVPPQGSDVRASIQVSPSLRGRILDLVYRPSNLYIRFTYGDGKRSPEYRLVPATARDGAPVGWFVADTEGLATYSRGHPTERIRAVLITADNPAHYARDYRVTFDAAP